MADSASEPEVPLDPVQAALVSRIRRMMLLSGAATLLGIAVVIGVIGYRVFRSDGSAPPDLVAMLPKGAKIVSTAVSGDRIVVTLEVQNALEIRLFDLRSLKAQGRLQFAVEP